MANVIKAQEFDDDEDGPTIVSDSYDSFFDDIDFSFMRDLKNGVYIEKDLPSQEFGDFFDDYQALIKRYSFESIGYERYLLVVRDGRGRKPSMEDKIKIRYKIFLEGSKNPVDSTTERQIGSEVKAMDSLLPFLVSVLCRIEVGAIAWAVSFGPEHGPIGATPRYPPGCKYLLHIELVGIVDPADDYMYVHDIDKFSMEEHLQYIGRNLIRAKHLFEAGLYADSNDLYRRVMGRLNKLDTRAENSAELELISEQRLRVLTNLMVVSYKLQQTGRTLRYADRLLESDGAKKNSRVKANYYRAEVFLDKRQLEEAEAATKQCLELDSANMEAQLLLEKIRAQRQYEKKREKRRVQAMFEPDKR